MNQLQMLYDVTKQLDAVLDTNKSSTKNRGAIIEQVNDLIQQRTELLEKVGPPFTEDEQRLGTDLVNLNEQVQEKMNQLFENLKGEMKQVKKQKKSNRNYMNPYENVKTVDGMYMDSKK